MKLARLAPLAMLFALTGPTSAEGLYVLVEATHSNDSLNRNQFDSTLTLGGATNLSSRASGGSNQLRLQGGYRFGQNWAAELGYIDFGKSRYSGSFAGGSAQGTVKAGGFDAVGLALLPFDASFTVFGKAGLVLASQSGTFNATLFSLGAAYSF